MKRQGEKGFIGRLGRLLWLLAGLISGAPQAQIWTCAAEGGQASCPKPETTDFACLGTFVLGDSRPCTGHSFPGPKCRTEGEALDNAIAHYVSIAPSCGQPSYGGLCPPAWNPTEMEFSLGELRWIRNAYVVNLPSEDPASGACNTVSFPTCGNHTAPNGFFGAIGNCLREVNCPPGTSPVDGKCMTFKSEVCKLGNPMDCVTGEKTQTETDLPRANGGSLEFTRYYSSVSFYEPRGTGVQSPNEHDARILGPNWRHTYQRAIRPEPLAPGQPLMMTVMRPDGDYRHFRLVDGLWVGRKDKSERLDELVNEGESIGWRYLTADNLVELYDVNGRLLSIRHTTGEVVTMVYSTAATPTTVAPFEGLLIEVVDSKDRRLRLSYDDLARLVEVAGPDGSVHAYDYSDKHALTSVVRPDGATRTYLYNEPAHNLNHFAGTLLTGIVDENGQRYATYRYSHNKIFEEWHGSADADKLTITYTSGPTPPYYYARTTDALGAFEQRDLVSVNGVVREKSRKRCTSYSCGTVIAEKSVTFDGAGNIATSTNDVGAVTEFTHDDRGRETRRIEVANAVAPHAAARRTIETDWHADWNLKTGLRVFDATNRLEAKTQWAYNPRGQLVARCEIDVDDPAALVYTCSATSAPPPTAKVRRWVYAYCEAVDVAAPGSTCPILGLVKSVNGPRQSTDAGMNGLDDMTSYQYYPSTQETGCSLGTAPCHRKGDLRLVTDALGRVTENVAYDRNGRVRRVRDPNGTLTDTAYDDRGRLQARTVRAQASGAANADDASRIFVHDAAGMITRVYQPDGAYLEYVYDDAHRLSDIIDSLGNRIHYTLDGAGNRITEETYDASYDPQSPGTGLKRALSREYNALRRLVRQRNAAGEITRDSTSYDSGGLLDGYDARGNEVAFKDGRNIQTRNTYDPLHRLVKQLEDYTGSDPETADATIEYGYDARDNVRTIRDAEGLTTAYTYDALGNPTVLASPDTGQTVSTFDLAGNTITQTDNRGITVTYVYDALNRPVHASYPTSSLDITLHYDESDAVTGCAGSFSLGRLTRVVDSSGTTTQCYDRRGNVTRKTHVHGGAALAASFAYTTADRIASITYPGGGIASYTYDAAGRVSLLTWKTGVDAVPVNIAAPSYYPFGPLNALTFGNGRTLVKNLDQNYAIDSIVSSASDGLALQFDVGVMGNVTRVAGTIGATAAERQYIYDNLYRITRVDDAAGAMLEDYGYNRTGDRTLKQFVGQAAQTYGYLAGTHRLGTTGGIVRTYDANGNTTSRGDGVTLGYDDRNRLTSAVAAGATTSYDHSASEERTLKLHTSGGALTTSRYLYDANGQILADEQQVDGGKKSRNVYLFIGATPVAVVRGTAVSYLESDHLDTPRVAVNATTNAVEWRWDLLGSAFGEHAATTLAAGKSVSLRYPGQYYDAETGLHYNYRRDYEAATGRYVESDPIGLEGGLATYEYAGSSPLDFTDPDGLRRRPGPRPGKSCGSGSSMEDQICPDPEIDCGKYCACRNSIELSNCNKKSLTKRHKCISSAGRKMEGCSSRCPGRNPGPGDDYYTEYSE